MLAANPTYVYVGTYTKPLPKATAQSVGIYVNTFDLATGALNAAGVAADVVNPSFVALDPSLSYLYAVSEVQELNGQPTGGVSAFAVSSVNGRLTFLNQKPSHGTDPCHVSVDRTGRFVLVANYSSGSVAMYPILPDGGLADASSIVQHVGHGVNPDRQAGPHAHSINPDPTNRFALVCDLGLDQVFVYRLDLSDGKLVPNDPPHTSVAPGSGPRHLAFHPTRPFVFVINEIASTITSFHWDNQHGTLKEIQTVSTLPKGAAGRNSTADIRVHPNGKFVYGSNRGHNTIAAFALDEASGQLRPIGHTSTQGAVPRNFNLDPTGTILLAANQNTGTVVAFNVNPANGALTPTGAVSAIPAPVCLQFAQR